MLQKTKTLPQGLRGLAAPLLAAAFHLATSAQADDFILSYWCGPPGYVKDLNKAYADVAKCGFNYAMLPCTGLTTKASKDILDACQKNKLKYIVYDPRIPASGPENPGAKTNLAAVVADYSKHPALGGYFVGDEPDHLGIPRVAAIHQGLVNADPRHAPFANLFPNYAPEWAFGGTYEQYVEKFITLVKPRLLSFDHYALMTDGSLRPGYFDNLEVIRRQGLKHNVPFCFIFQLTPHGSYRDPSEAELRWQVNTGLAYGAKALMYFTYWHPPKDPLFQNSVAVVDVNGNPTHHYERVKRVNAAINAWAPTLMKLKSTGVYHTGTLPRGAAALPKDSVVRVGEGALVMGMFTHQDGSEWLMAVNREFSQLLKTELHFDKTVKRLRELSAKNGKLSSVKLRDHVLQIDLPAGGAKLFKLTR